MKGANSAGTTNGNDLTFSTSACPPPVVILGKTASTSAAAVGSYVTFNLTATNPTASPLNNVVVTDAHSDGHELQYLRGHAGHGDGVRTNAHLDYSLHAGRW